MGLLKDGINEVIATTFQNAAPMGLICRNEKARMVVFRGSHTAERVRQDGWLVANFIFDPRVYVRTAFEDLPPGDFIEEKAAGITVQRLAGAEAWAAYRAEVERETEEALLVNLTSLREVVCSSTLHPINRGFNSIIEATVHATRFQISHDPRLYELIRHHTALVRRCGGTRELEALDLLYSYLDFGKEE
ncbi:MAG: DUF447 family protein [Methanoregulaceae archaeon]|nr:DUF447 family protein [Methanoregulaceae archaeon]